MATELEAESTLTDRYQTTVPDVVRRALKLGKRDKIQYTVRQDGEVVLTRVSSAQGDDPVLGQFLAFLAHDIAKHPERLRSLDAGFVKRIEVVLGDVEIDLDTALPDEDE